MHLRKIYGAPGTGKTTQMLNDLDSEISAVDVDRIGFITHTVAARDEAKGRAKTRFLSAIEQDLKYFKTIHGICYQHIGLGRNHVMQTEDYMKFGDEIGIMFSDDFTAELDMDNLPIGFSNSPGSELLAVLQYAAANMVKVSQIQERWPLWIDFDTMKEFYYGYEAFKKREAKFDFVDMLKMYLNSGSALDIDVMFIDEAQDLSLLQWNVVKKMIGNTQRCYVAGDDDQSIFNFIGADKFGFLHLASDSELILPISYRLKNNIWRYAKRIISDIKHRKIKQIDVQGPGGVIDVWNLPIEHLNIDQNKTTMIVARHNKQIRKISNQLNSYGIPHVLKGHSITKDIQCRAVDCLIALMSGESRPLKDIATIFRARKDKETVGKIMSLARENPDAVFSFAFCTEQYNLPQFHNWKSYFSDTTQQIQKNEIIESILQNSGRDAISKFPQIELCTFHNSKGKEADHVVLMTDCYKSAWDGYERDPDDERRLSYVGVTRARERLTIVQPDTDMYMRTLA